MGFIGTVNGKIIRRKNKTGYSFNFLICHNRRDGYGRAGYDVVWNFKTIRDMALTKQANTFWKQVELVLTSLVRDGKIYASDADKIRRQFAEYIPIPFAPITVPAPVPIAKPKANPIVAERVQDRFKDFM